MSRDDKALSRNNAYEVSIHNWGRGKQFEPKYELHGKHPHRANQYDPRTVWIDNVKELRELHELLSNLIKDAECRDKRHIPKVLKSSPEPISDRFAEMEYDE